ncbi:antibiotic biosynthesis monooxygenase [candidate division KSB1 bacterium]|nr:antibiotic biosynthesis monooxygenase [candidate division KSB1 bacterium]
MYRPDGPWVRLFKEGKGYIKTELHQNIENKTRFLTIDFWTSKSAYDSFRKQFSEEFEELDKVGETLTKKEIHLGSFHCFE